MKVLDLLNIGSTELKSKKIRTHQLDSEILLSKVLKKRREDILLNLDMNVEIEKINKYRDFIKRRSLREPIAYIVKEKEFWSKSFFVNKNTLIPRPETELMVEKLLKLNKNKSINILDIGTGSGCILISLLTELSTSRGTAIDVSNKALNIAIKNSKKANVKEKIKFLNTSLSNIYYKKYDLVVSNPPYLKTFELKNLEDDVRIFEPKIALDGGNDGLDLITKIIYKMKSILRINGMLALEIGYGQYKKVSKKLIRNNFKIIDIVKDYKNNERCIISKLVN